MMLALTTANFESSRGLTEARKSSKSVLDPKESIRPFKSMAGASSMVKSGAYLETGNPNSNLDRFPMEKYECNICLADCSYKRYKSNKVFDCDFCPSCFFSGRFELGLAPLYLICIEYAEDYNDEKSTNLVSINSEVCGGGGTMYKSPIKKKFPNFKEVKLPNFKGGDPTNWILGVEHFFEFYRISDAEKLKYAWLGLSGSATLWYYKHIKPRIHEISWSLFLEKLIDQFDSTKLEGSNKSMVVDEENVIDDVSCEKNRNGVVFDSLEKLEMEDHRSDKSSKVFDELENQGKEKLIDQFGILEIEVDDAELGRKIQEDVVVEDCDVVEGENQKDDKAAVTLDEKPSIVAISIDGGALKGLFSSTLLPLSDLVSVVGGHFILDNEIVMKAFGVPKSYMKLLFLMQTVAKSTVERRLCFDPGGKVEFSKKRVERYIHTGACRMLSDCAALGIGLYASFISLLPADQWSNYGRGRTEHIIYEVPTYGRHHFCVSSRCYSEKVISPFKRPAWFNDLHRNSITPNLEAVVLAVNCTDAAVVSFEWCLRAIDTHTGFCIISRLVSMLRYMLAGCVASISTAVYVVLQLVYCIVKQGSQSFFQIVLRRIFTQTRICVHIRSCQLLYWPISLLSTGYREQSKSNIEYAHKAALRKHSMWSNIAMDLILGMMGVPAGFKLNTERADLLGMVSLNVVQIFSTLWFFTGSLFLQLLKGFAIQALASLWRLFRERKWNPLRQRKRRFPAGIWFEISSGHHGLDLSKTSDIANGVPETVVSILHSNYATLGQVVAPNYRNLLQRLSLYFGELSALLRFGSALVQGATNVFWIDIQHNTMTVYLHHAIAEYAEALASKMPGNLKFNTFGGNPVSSAGGLAVFQVLDKEKRQSHCADVGTHLVSRLTALRQKHEIIGVVRGKGLMLGVEFVTDRKEKTPAKEETAVWFEKLKDLGVLVEKGGLHANFFRIKPPMCFTKEDADFLADVLGYAISGL